MDLDEWGKEDFDEWEIDSYDIETPQSISNGFGDTFSNFQGNNIYSTQNPNSLNGNSSFGSFNSNTNGNHAFPQQIGPFPEVEIGSSSDDDAPPLPESSKLARENLELRNRVSQLMDQSKNVEKKNVSLKGQLKKCRNIFKHQLKSMKKVFS